MRWIYNIYLIYETECGHEAGERGVPAGRLQGDQADERAGAVPVGLRARRAAGRLAELHRKASFPHL